MTEPYFKYNLVSLYNGDARDMSAVPDESVQCVITSPPYWGLRKYTGEQELIWGGEPDCPHRWGPPIEVGDNRYRGENAIVGGQHNAAVWGGGKMLSTFCTICGAWKGAYGLEPTPEMYVEHTIVFLREIRRVLRKDGVVFWNIGDSYWGSGGEHYKGSGFQPASIRKHGREIALALERRLPHKYLKPKDLCLIPERVAIAAQEDGWWVRTDIIWSKENSMPESVKDRPTISHEHI